MISQWFAHLAHSIFARREREVVPRRRSRTRRLVLPPSGATLAAPRLLSRRRARSLRLPHRRWLQHLPSAWAARPRRPAARPRTRPSGARRGPRAPPSPARPRTRVTTPAVLAHAALEHHGRDDLLSLAHVVQVVRRHRAAAAPRRCPRARSPPGSCAPGRSRRTRCSARAMLAGRLDASSDGAEFLHLHAEPRAPGWTGTRPCRPRTACSWRSPRRCRPPRR